MNTSINSLYQDPYSRYTKALPNAPTDSIDPNQTMISKTLPSLPERKSSLPERKSSRAMTIPRRAVGSTSSASKKASIASISSSGYSESILSRSLSRNGNFTKDSLSYAGSKFRKTPPILEKDAQREISPKTPNRSFGSPRSISSLRLSPGQEIWRRRSLVTQKGIEFPYLKLQKSNGSTANSPSKNVNPTHDRSFPRLPSQPRQSRGLPDRERGPIPAREAPQAPVVPPMGAKISKLKEISKRKATDQTDESIRHSDRHTDQSRHARQVNTSNSSHDRLPTPEHLISGENKSQPPSPQVFSPTTPRDLSTAHQVFIRSDDGHTHGISVPMAGGLSPFAELPLVPNLLNSNHSRDPSETLTITSLPNVVRSPQPQKPHSTKTILTPQPSPPLEPAPFSPPSITSTTPTITTNPHSRQTSRTTTSRATSLSYSYFPLSPSSLPAPGTVLPAPPITSQHLDCYQSHRFMRRSRNNICPLQCQTCSKADFEQQWKCTWCCLRICGDCMAVLATVRKDLQTFLGLIGRDVPSESTGKTTVVGNDVDERSKNAAQKNETRQLNMKY